MSDAQAAADFHRACDDAGVHTVEVAAPDTQGHLRGKRVPVDRFFVSTIDQGVNIADAMFVFDMQNDLPDNPYVNMETGYLDCRLIPDVSTGRLLTYRPGYAIVFTDALDAHGAPHGLAPRNVLAAQIERCRAAGLDPVVATELEFYLCTPDWEPVQQHIQYSSLTDALPLEDCLREMRAALAGAGLEVESSNAEYGAGQVEINISYADAMTAADNTVLFKSIVKQVAVQHDLRATFMPKPWADQAGSGMHVHTSLGDGSGKNAFADSDGEPNELMARWVSGLLEHAQALTLLGAPTSNGSKRIRPYTFAPTHVHWGLDNRSVLCRCIAEGSPANRVEFRSAGADANAYLITAGILAAGLDGVQRELELPALGEGDLYANPGDSAPIPADLPSAIGAYRGSRLAEQLGEMFSTTYLCLADHEMALGAEHAGEGDDVNEWERARYAEHC